MFGSAASNATLEEVVSELHDLLLVHNSVVVIDVFTFFVLIESLSLFLSLQLSRWGGHTTGIEVINTFVIYHGLNILELNISVERHVRHHDSDVFRGNKSIVVKIIPKQNQGKTYLLTCQK